MIRRSRKGAEREREIDRERERERERESERLSGTLLLRECEVNIKKYVTSRKKKPYN